MLTKLWNTKEIELVCEINPSFNVHIWSRITNAEIQAIKEDVDKTLMESTVVSY